MVPVLNGLGTVKYEELFVVYRTVDRLLRAAGVEVVDPEVGEFCTSFDMAGCSLTLLWLDDELERLWTAPADTPAFRRGSVAARERVDTGAAEVARKAIPPASAESRRAAAVIATLLSRAADVIDEKPTSWGAWTPWRATATTGSACNAAAGPGRTPRAPPPRPVRAPARRSPTPATPGPTRAAGPPACCGAGCCKPSAGRSATTRRWTRRRCRPVSPRPPRPCMGFGKAQVGDKTMIDAIVPFVDALAGAVGAGRGLGAAWRDAAGVAAQAARDTAQLAAKLGRARSHGDRSIGTPDPGAMSFAMVCTTVSEELGHAAAAEGSD